MPTRKPAASSVQLSPLDALRTAIAALHDATRGGRMAVHPLVATARASLDRARLRVACALRCNGYDRLPARIADPARGLEDLESAVRDVVGLSDAVAWTGEPLRSALLTTLAGVRDALLSDRPTGGETAINALFFRRPIADADVPEAPHALAGRPPVGPVVIERIRGDAAMRAWRSAVVTWVNDLAAREAPPVKPPAARRLPTPAAASSAVRRAIESARVMETGWALKAARRDKAALPGEPVGLVTWLQKHTDRLTPADIEVAERLLDEPRPPSGSGSGLTWYFIATESVDEPTATAAA
jgi:hypothetical protein